MATTATTSSTDYEQLTNLAAPTTAATITLRIIKSFEFRTEKSLVLHNLNLQETTVGRLKQIARECMFLFFF